ncbi:MerR family transcriptional regulator [Streptomyces fructofermentans]|uniref:MerR family transcriptional regulator n=1 Tax=Streptomyces fructofermentans TaxID=152141 RepID=A0A918KLE6_9ACTN|nr:MerR family transcriptional regulator [Streptomyces fructofermentans]GGX66923.1 MerR family transcriptional regulator [Streptomyces fructofermentans]
MRIGELAAAVGVTTRTVRHYHQLGLLPEAERRPNGYREYGLRHAVALARIRRLTELGLGLTEVRDVLADDAGRDLAEVLEELDEDLARQEAAVRERRLRLRALLDGGALPAEGPVSPELAAVFGRLTRHPEPPMAARDREMIALLETAAAPEDRERLVSALRAAADAPGALERAHEAYALLDALAGAEPDDPRVEETARALADCLPDEALEGLGLGRLGADGSDPLDGGGFLRALLDDFAPAQGAAVLRTIRLLTERAR